MNLLELRLVFLNKVKKAIHETDITSDQILKMSKNRRAVLIRENIVYWFRKNIMQVKGCKTEQTFIYVGERDTWDFHWVPLSYPIISDFFPCDHVTIMNLVRKAKR